MSQRRSDPRARIDIPVSLVDDDGRRTPGRAVDVSVGGIRVETDTPPLFGSPVEVRLRLPRSTREVTLPAVVRWVQGQVVGLQFGLLGVRETHLITALAQERSLTLGTQDVAWIG